MLKENINTEINELDILAQIDEKYNQNINNSKDNDILNFLEEFNNLNKQTTPKVEINNLRKTTNIISFIIKYITTSAAIFILLM
ncbi:MAG: hypothetical protein U9Q66_01380 [Patescibacteria group bacterium]|nr:hypothetical protein [Patescibacteria group bacterium]